MDKFLKYLRFELYRSEHTVEAYRRDLEQFVTFITSQGLTLDPTGDFNPAHVTTADIRLWLAHLATNQCSPRSLRRKTQSLRAYFRYLCRMKTLKANPAQDIILAKLPKPLPDFVKDSDMERILDTALAKAESPAPIRSDNANPPATTHSSGSATLSAQRHLLALRDHLILHLLYATGMRRAEILSLTDENIALGAARIRVIGKGNKERVIPVADSLIDEIIAWQEARDKVWHLPRPRPLIATRFGAMSESNFEQIIKRLLKDEKTGRHSPHTLRHTFATAMLNGGADLNSVRAILGHASLSTTQIYTHLQYSDLRREYSHAHPRASHPSSDDHTK